MVELTAGLSLLLGAIVFSFGAVFGSFANVVIHRLPRGESVAFPGSHCPNCGRSIAWFENVPLLSYVALRARCRGCSKPISIRYPAVEALTGAACVATAFQIGLKPELPAFLTFVVTLIILSAIDLEHRRIPNKILGPASVAAAVLLAGAAVISGAPGLLVRVALGALAYGVPMLLIALAAPSGMGMGDVKLAAYLGGHLAWFSMAHVAVGAFLGFFLGSFVGLLLIALGRKSRKDGIPFGPSMAAGAGAALLLGAPILKLWLG